jgi:hypothetical protein
VIKKAIVTLLVILVSSLAIVYIVVPLSTVFSLQKTKHISGTVMDCETNEPITDAAVSIYGNSWGWSDAGGLIWDKEYSATTQSTLSGAFTLEYILGTSVVTRKDGYYTAQNFIEGGAMVEVGLRKINDLQPATERTYTCRFESECVKSRIENGVDISWNDCTSPR